MSLPECFLISPIGDDGSETRKHADKVLKHIVSKACEHTKYKIVRADQIDDSGIISNQIIQRIVSADLVIADLSFGNPNVYYELSLRHAIRKPFIHIARQGERISFDISHNRTLFYDLTELDSVEATVEGIKKQIAEIKADKADLENPISVGVDLKILRDSGREDAIKTANIFEELTRVQLQMNKIETLNIAIMNHVRSLAAKQQESALIQEHVILKALSGNAFRSTDQNEIALKSFEKPTENRSDFYSLVSGEDEKTIADERNFRLSWQTPRRIRYPDTAANKSPKKAAKKTESD